MKKYLSGSRDAHAAYEAGREKGFERGEAAGYEKGERGLGVAYALAVIALICAVLVGVAYGNDRSARAERKIKELQARLEQVYTGGFISSSK